MHTDWLGAPGGKSLIVLLHAATVDADEEEDFSRTRRRTQMRFQQPWLLARTAR